MPISLFGKFKDGGLESWRVDFPAYVRFTDAMRRLWVDHVSMVRAEPCISSFLSSQLWTVGCAERAC